MKPLLEQLDRMATDRALWNRADGMRTYLQQTVGEVTVCVVDTEVGPCWCVKEAGSEVLLHHWSEAQSIPHAMRTACDFARSYLLSLGEPHPTN